MGKIQKEIKYLQMLEGMYGIKNKWRFNTRFYKRHPEKIALRRKRLTNALTPRPLRTGFVGFDFSPSEVKCDKIHTEH